MVGIGMTMLILGMLIICMGWNTEAKGAAVGAGALLVIGGTCIGIGGGPSSDMPNGSPALVVLGFLLSVAGIVLTTVKTVKGKKKRRKTAVHYQDLERIGFYRECVSSGIRECRSEKEIQKATLIAQKRKLKFTDIAALYAESKAPAEKSDETARENALEKKREEERKKCAELEKFSELNGREKRIAMLTEEREKEKREAQTLRAGADAVLSASQQKEHDWAVLGGIAEGIAGPAAGAATALDAQAKNAQIRAQNAQNLRSFAPLMSASYQGAAAHDHRAQALSAQIENTKTKLISQDSTQECLNHLRFSGTEVSVSETGTCTVSTRAALSKPWLIFEDVRAVVDGTVLAKIYDENGKIAGVAKLVLPMYGLSEEESELQGMSLFCGRKDGRYTARFDAANLWAMEK